MVEVFEKVSGVQEVGTEFALKGGGVAGALIVGSKVGKVFENLAVTPVIATSPTKDKWIGWGANNLPKGLAALGLAKVKTGQRWIDDMITGGVYGLAGSVGIDTVARLTNAGAPVAFLGSPLETAGSDVKVQALLAENAQLKASLDKLSAGAPLVKVAAELPYGIPTMPYTAAAAAVKDVQERKYQFAKQNLAAPVSNEQKYAFAGKEVSSPEVLVQAFGFSRGD
jgi:hypothetical protein